MRRSILFFLILALGYSAAFSQAQFNIKAGANITQANEKYNDGEIDGKVGYQIGFEARFGDRFYVSPGLYYYKHQSRINFIEDGNLGVNLPDYTVNFEGFRIPLFVGGDLIKGENWGLRLYTGPNASFVLNTNDGLPGYEDDAFREVLWGFNGGLGVDLGIFTIDLSQEWRLNNVFDGDTPEFKNNITYLSVGLLF
ncbi:MAG: PorT family protein [Lewinellaceae bacterium]|nr:PorT family protein [Lewinellaceae bacterium]